jgi:hypothetical protein
MVRFERGLASARYGSITGESLCIFLEFIISVIIIPSGFPAGDLPS